MKDSEPINLSGKRSKSTKPIDSKIIRSQLKDTLKIKKEEIQKLSYEKSLSELDAIILELQNDNVLLEQLELSYLQGKLYLEHCENLLEVIEQEVIEIDAQAFDELIE